MSVAVSSRLYSLKINWCFYSSPVTPLHFGPPTPPSSRSAHGTSEDNAVQIPPLGKTALVWGLFLGVSANIRYQVSEQDRARGSMKKCGLMGLHPAPQSSIPCSIQIVFGLERLVDLTIAKKVPQVAYGTTVGIRFTNNVIGECDNHADPCAWAMGSLWAV